MTQIQTPRTASILAGPRGIGARAAGGAYTQDCQQDIGDADSFELAPIELSGTTDAINPHVPGNYVIKTGSADAISLTASGPIRFSPTLSLRRLCLPTAPHSRRQRPLQPSAEQA